jgi:cell wall-associated NlpC family hydrolase
MTTTHVYTHIRRYVCLALVAAAFVMLGLPQQVTAKPMPQSQERVIAQSAKEAVAIFDSLTELSAADRNDVFSALVADIARQAAMFLGVDVRAMQQAWLTADLIRQRALINGLTQLGVPYKLNSAIENVAFDCSGLVAFAWGKAGVALSRGSSAQFASATLVKVEEAQPGDLIWRPVTSRCTWEYQAQFCKLHIRAEVLNCKR